MDFPKRTWAEINLSALAANINEISRLSPGKEIIAVVKANAYGHGDDIICPELTRLGVSLFAVSSVEEALRVKRYAPDGDVLIFGFAERAYLNVAAENNFILTAGDAEYAKALSAFAVTENKKVRVHIKLNTGMNRVGINTGRELDEILRLPGLRCEAVYTHFASADSLDKDDIDFTRRQQEKLLALSKGKGLKIHSQNSGGVLFHSDAEADFVRAGLILYGYLPDARLASPVKLSPVMSLKSVICQIRSLNVGDTVSYGRTYMAPGSRTAAVVPVGYADGYTRLHSNSGVVAVKGILCPVLGRVCMDQIIIDVSEVNGVRVGDEIEIYSSAHKETSIEYIAEKLGTIPYEITCSVSGRVRRVPTSPEAALR